MLSLIVLWLLRANVCEVALIVLFGLELLCLLLIKRQN